MTKKPQKPKISENAKKAMDVSMEVVKNMTKEELCYIAENNPCVRGMITGYTSEYHLEKMLRSIEGVTNLYKPDDHDRKKNKSDYILTYKGKTIRIQSKSIQTNSIREHGGIFSARVQNDASDKHDIILPNGKKVKCTNYAYGGYDILAVCLVNFTNKMNFCFKLNSECRPCTNSRTISPENSVYLMSTAEKITYPLSGEWTTDILDVMDRVEKTSVAFHTVQKTKQMIMNL